MIFLAGGAEPPINDFGLVDRVAVIGGGVEAGRLSDGAVDIDDLLAPPADEVVMVVAHPRFVERRSTGGFNAADDPDGHQGIEIVVDGLAGQRSEPLSCGGHDEFGIAMPALLLHHVQHGLPGRGEAQTRLVQQVSDVFLHALSLAG